MKKPFRPIWFAHVADLPVLYQKWKKRRDEGGDSMSTRMREIQTACMFSMCLEYSAKEKKIAIGFQQRDKPEEATTVDELFSSDFHVIEEDCDVFLVDLNSVVESQPTETYRLQLTSFVYQKETTERQMVQFLEKKLRRTPDDDLLLVLHIEQEGPINLDFLHLYLNHKTCPYAQVFVVFLGYDKTSEIPAPTYNLYLVYPEFFRFACVPKDEATKILSRPTNQPKK